MAIETIDYSLCNDCGICFDYCPMDVFRKVASRVYIAYPKDCMTCHFCTMYCPKDCIYVGPARARPIPECY